jgi:tRNA threonylcarbamoyl adenosine modification protein YeaZ
MLVLAIDTTSEKGGVALYRNLDCLASAHNPGSSGFSVTLFQMVDQVLTEAGAKLSGEPIPLRDVELIAAANGPGSFTGIRTGLAAVQGWATALGRPVVGVTILAAMAQEAQPQTEWAASIMDARRNEFYLGLFRRDASGNGHFLNQAGEGMVLTRDEVRRFLEAQLTQGKVVSCIGRDCDLAAQALRTDLPGSTRWKTVPGFLVGTIARMSLEAHRRGQLQSPAQLDALYIRRPDAEVNWRP